MKFPRWAVFVAGVVAGFAASQAIESGRVAAVQRRLDAATEQSRIWRDLSAEYEQALRAKEKADEAGIHPD